MTHELQTLITRQQEDFIVERTESALVALKANEKYREETRSYLDHFTKIMELSPVAGRLVFNLDEIVGAVSCFETRASYRQGLKDGLALAKGGSGNGYEFQFFRFWTG